MRKFRFILFTLLLVLPSLSAQAATPIIDGCQVFPPENPWNTDVSSAPVHPNSANYIANILANGGDNVHPDFGEDPSYGIPWITVPGTQPLVPITFDYDDESDPGPYPIPPDAPVEGGGDRHVIVIDRDNCVLYEVYAATYLGGPQNAWEAGSGAIFDLDSNALRPEGWTSADAAGLPILPGLARCEEVMSGEINHALRFTVNRTQRAYIYPARHFASSYTGTNYPPMGLRLRLKSNYDISGFSGQASVIAAALKRYGMILADNGSNWYISGETNPSCWNDDELNDLKSIPGTAFEVIVSPPAIDEVPIRNFYTTTTPTLSWTRISWAAQYRLQISTASNFNALVLNQLVPGGAAEWAPTLTNGDYYWRVQPIDSSGVAGGWTPIDRFLVNAPVP
jgi:hypothetical protein